MPIPAFFIANPGHHTAMVRPVVQSLAAAGVRCRVLSLCEFRGFDTPAFAMDNVELVSLVPFRFRGKPGSGKTGGRSGMAKELARRGLRQVAWQLLRLRIASCLGDTNVAVLPNDTAYPYREIVGLLHARRVPFVLLQEGIRFSLPEAAGDAYGRGGARAIAAWGESSADFFRAQGVSDEHIHLTGNPRFDDLDREGWARKGRELRTQLGLDGRRVLLYLSNPIEHLGLVASTDAKLALFREFCAAVDKLPGSPQVLVKLHGGEDPETFKRVLAGVPPTQIRVIEDVPLYSLMAMADAAVVVASTVGMEALMFDLPLGVVEVPRHGYAFDYVSSGAAVGLGHGADMVARLAQLIDGGESTRASRDRYMARMIAVRSGATERVADLVARSAGA